MSDKKLQMLTDVEWVDIDSVHNSEWNPQIHDDANIQAIKRSIIEFGLVYPVLVNAETDCVVGGHGTRMAIRELIQEGKYRAGPSGKAIPIMRGNWTEDEAMALALALNYIQSDADSSKLADVVERVQIGWEENRLHVMALSDKDLETLERLTQSVEEFKDTMVDKFGDVELPDESPLTAQVRYTVSNSVMRAIKEARAMMDSDGMTDDEFISDLLDRAEIEAMA